MRVFLREPEDQVSEFVVNVGDVKTAAQRAEQEFNKVSEEQPHPCRACGAAFLCKYFSSGIPDTDKHAHYQTAFMHLLVKCGVDITKAKESTIDVDLIGRHFGFDVIKKDVEFIHLAIESDKGVFRAELPKNPSLVFELCNDVMQSLDHPCFGCLALLIDDRLSSDDELDANEITPLVASALVIEKMRLNYLTGYDAPDEAVLDIRYIDIDKVVEYGQFLAATADD